MKQFIFYLLVMMAAIGCTTKETIVVYNEGEYVGGANCLSCHQAEYELWKGSHHDWAMRLPYDSTVLGDFNNTRFSADGEDYYFFKKDSSFYVRTNNPEGTATDFKIAYTFGFTPLQQYLIEFPDGKYQTLRASWDSDSNRWFNQYSGQEIARNDWLHWQQGGQRWNTMCAECHSTNLVKNYNASKDHFNTTFDDINVNCEACHGAGGSHMNWAAQEEPAGNPRILLGWERGEQLNLCFGCHARRVKLTTVMKPGEYFDDQFRIQTINNNYYHADGQIKDEDYVAASFMESKMFHNNVRCTNCHNAHSMKTVYQGNLLCLQCHAIDYDSENHHFHPMESESALCVSCHMTDNIYMGNDARRDHSFRRPRPDQSVEYGTPNACTRCHTDQTDQWAADWVVRWYGPDRADSFTDYLLMASRPPYTDEQKKTLLPFITDTKYPAIARATVLEYYPLTGTEDEYRMILAAVQDSAALVRYHALNKLSALPIENRVSFALEHVIDSARMVRIGAAELMVDQPMDALPATERGYAKKALNELQRMLFANADFPAGRLQLGDYYLRKNDIHAAIREYEMALKMDSLLIPVYSNLATSYNMIGDNNLAIETLNALVTIQPDYARGYYLRGLLQNEMDHQDDAITDLEKAINLDPGNFRAYYNLANLYYQQKKMAEAERTIRSGLLLWPDSEEGNYLLQLIKQASGN